MKVNGEVKKLEWVEHYQGCWENDNPDSLLIFTIRRCKVGDGYYVEFQGIFIGNTFIDEEAAKKFCQDHFENLIKSCIKEI